MSKELVKTSRTSSIFYNYDPLTTRLDLVGHSNIYLLHFFSMSLINRIINMRFSFNFFIVRYVTKKVSLESDELYGI